MDIDTLINSIKAGDDDAYNDLLRQYNLMIYKIINSFDLKSGDYSIDEESLYQEGCLALYNAAKTYRDDKGMKFSSYAYMNIKSRICNYYIRSKKQIFNQSSIDIAENVDYKMSFVNNHVNSNPIEYHKYTSTQDNINTFLKTLSYEDKQIFLMKYHDYSYTYIAQRLHINNKRVDNRLRILRKKLKEYLKDK